MAQGNMRSAAGGGSSKPVSSKAPKQRIRSIRCLVRADGVSLLGLSTRQEPPSAVALRNAPAGAVPRTLFTRKGYAASVKRQSR